jgi:hypothetical protein
MTVSELSRTIESQADLLEPVLKLDLTSAIDRFQGAQQILAKATPFETGLASLQTALEMASSSGQMPANPAQAVPALGVYLAL